MVVKKKRVKTAKQERPTPSIRTANVKRAVSTKGIWKRSRGGTNTEFNGLQVWSPIDPYTTAERDSFRLAMKNPYVYRANILVAKLVCGQGYTTSVVPRGDEDIDEALTENWQREIKIFVPHLNKEMTPLEIKNFIDRISIDMDLANNIYNAYLTSREQGRGILAFTPIDELESTDDTPEFQIPTSIRFIRPEFTLRPYLDPETSELIGVQIVGLTSSQQFVLPTERMIYIENGFNQELFSDHFGKSQVEEITNVANVLNLIYTDDFVQAAESTWHQPKVFGVPIQPQDFGDEDAVLDKFLKANQNSKGQDIAVVKGPDGEGGVTVLSATTNSGDISGLNMIAVRCIKAILAYYNIPPFMLSEGDKGSLGGNSNNSEIDMFENSELIPEKLKLDKTVESQYYDKILAILFHVSDPSQVPIKLLHKYNKAKITTMFRPDLYEIGKDMVNEGLIEKSKLADLVGFGEFAKKETATTGEDTSPSKDTWINKGVMGQSPLTINFSNKWARPKSEGQWASQAI